MVDPETHTLVLLREMRADIKEVRRQLDETSKPTRAMHLNGTRALKSLIGHRVMVERTLASFDDQVGKLEATVAQLKAAQA